MESVGDALVAGAASLGPENATALCDAGPLQDFAVELANALGQFGSQHMQVKEPFSLFFVGFLPLN